MNFFNIKAGDWETLWDKLDQMGMELPCSRHRNAVEKHATLRSYLMSRRQGESFLGAYATRIYLSRFTGFFETSGHGSRKARFTQGEVDEIMARLKRLHP